MAVYTLTDIANYLANPQTVKPLSAYPEHRAGDCVHHVDCPNCPPNLKKKDWNCTASPKREYPYDESTCHEKCHRLFSLFLEKSYEGCVLRLFERNGYHDSDFYAVCWSWELMRPVEVQYATTRGWCGPSSADVDATPEAREAHEKYQRAWAFKRWTQRNETEAKTPEKNKTVHVYKGRKVPKGTVGKVFWVGSCSYSGKPRLGIETGSGEKHYTAASNCEVVDFEQYLQPESSFEAHYAYSR